MPEVPDSRFGRPESYLDAPDARPPHVVAPDGLVLQQGCGKASTWRVSVASRRMHMEASRSCFSAESFRFTTARRVPAVLAMVVVLAALVAFLWHAAPALAAAPKVISESAPSATASEARLEALVNPENEVTECHFQYGKTLVTENEVPCEQPVIEGEEQGVGVTVTGLTQGTVYHYRVVLKNLGGEEALGATEHFTTAIPPEVPEGVALVEAKGVSLKVEGVVNPHALGNPGSFEFLYKRSASECEGESSVSGPSTGAKGEVVEAEATGLLPNTKYSFCVQAHNEAGEASAVSSPPVAFTTLAVAPAVTEEQSAEVGATSTKLNAQLDPGGSPTTYVVQYGTSSVEEHSTPALSAGASSAPVTVSQELSGLAPDSEYHYRFVATNTVQAGIDGEAKSFTTFPPSVSALPDGRAYELVSQFAPGTGEEAYSPFVGSSYIGEEEHGIKTSLPFRVAASGEAVVYAGDPPPTKGNSSRGEGNGNEYLARRTAKGWESSDLQPAGIEGPAYEAFSTDLSVGILESQEGRLGGGEGEYRDLYFHSTGGGAEGEYHPFFTGTPPYRNTNEFGLFGSSYAGANAGTSTVPAFSDLLFEANDALPTLNVAAVGGSGEDPSSQIPFQDEYNLYDSAGGGLYLVNVLPDGKTEPNAVFGQYPDFDVPLVPNSHAGANLVSAGGSRIFWTNMEGNVNQGKEPTAVPKALYVRENPTQPQSPVSSHGECLVSTDACTIQIDASQNPGVAGGGGRFWAASSDGSKAFFTDESQLTVGSTAETGEPDLYEYEVNAETGAPGALTDLTVDEHAGEHANVQGVVGTSEDGSYLYFAADGVLAGANTEGHAPIAGRPNLYLYRGGESKLTFIATLSPEDGDDVPPLTESCESANPGFACPGDWQALAGYRTAEVTPDGHSLVFMSNQSLTGYDNAAQQSGYGQGGLDEVFDYEASSGALHCISCNPSGEPPVPTELSTHGYQLPIGGFIPTSRAFGGEQPRVISADGSRVFFNSGEPLLPTATNGWLDVYEWERAGTPGGSCPASVPGGGCVYLISNGTGPENSYLLGADESGANAFFISRAQLTPADRGNEGDVVYDARVDGIQPPAVAACEGTGCQGVPPTPPIFATPASVTFNGTGNFPPAATVKPVVKSLTRAQKLTAALKLCKKDKKKAKRQACEKQAKQKYGAKTKSKSKKAKKANDRRGK
jgi:hypothetical protein